MVAVTAERDGMRQVGRRARGGQTGLELFDASAPDARAGGRRRRDPHARTPAGHRPGPMPVIVSNGWGGVLFHEAVGHGLEADHIEQE